MAATSAPVGKAAPGPVGQKVWPPRVLPCLLQAREHEVKVVRIFLSAEVCAAGDHQILDAYRRRFQIFAKYTRHPPMRVGSNRDIVRLVQRDGSTTLAHVMSWSLYWYLYDTLRLSSPHEVTIALFCTKKWSNWNALGNLR